MKKVCSVLILEDNEIVASCIQKRLHKAGATFSATTGVEVNAEYLILSPRDPTNAGQEIEAYLQQHPIDLLLLDRGFFQLLQSPPPDAPTNWNPDCVYIPKGDKGTKVTDLLLHANFDRLRKLKGVIVYTYDEPSRTSEYFIEPADIKKETLRSLRNSVDSDYVDVVLTNSELYNLADLQLYTKPPIPVGDYFEVGKKSSFMLYGLFMGEVLYHRTVHLLARRRNHRMLERRRATIARLFLLYVVFAGLGIGSAALYDIALESVAGPWGLLALSGIFSLVVPGLVLVLKPSLVLDLEAE